MQPHQAQSVSYHQKATWSTGSLPGCWSHSTEFGSRSVLSFVAPKSLHARNIVRLAIRMLRGRAPAWHAGNPGSDPGHPGLFWVILGRFLPLKIGTAPSAICQLSPKSYVVYRQVARPMFSRYWVWFRYYPLWIAKHCMLGTSYGGQSRCSVEEERHGSPCSNPGPPVVFCVILGHFLYHK